MWRNINRCVETGPGAGGRKGAKKEWLELKMCRIEDVRKSD